MFAYDSKVFLFGGQSIVPMMYGDYNAPVLSEPMNDLWVFSDDKWTFTQGPAYSDTVVCLILSKSLANSSSSFCSSLIFLLPELHGTKLRECE